MRVLRETGLAEEQREETSRVGWEKHQVGKSFKSFTKLLRLRNNFFFFFQSISKCVTFVRGSNSIGTLQMHCFVSTKLYLDNDIWSGQVSWSVPYWMEVLKNTCFARARDLVWRSLSVR